MTPHSPIEDAVLGLAAGDALAWTGDDHREHLLPARRLAALRRMEAFSDANDSTTLPRPYVHASPTKLLGPHPSDDLEWFTFTAGAAARATKADDTRSDLEDTWTALATTDGKVRARTGTKIALSNLRKGLKSPQSGHDNPHYFDDIACVRAIAAGVLYPGRPNDAAALAELDSQITHSLDGVWCARAVAVLVCHLAAGSTVGNAVDAAITQLPENTWSRRLSQDALTIASSTKSTINLAFQLTEHVTDRIYSYAIAAPETLALLLAHVTNATDPDQLMLGAFAHGRNGDTLPALIGAICGLRFGNDWIPERITNDDLILDGVCVPALKGSSVSDVIALLITSAAPSSDYSGRG